MVGVDFDSGIAPPDTPYHVTFRHIALHMGLLDRRVNPTKTTQNQSFLSGERDYSFWGVALSMGNETVVDTESLHFVIRDTGFDVRVAAMPFKGECTDDDLTEIKAFLENMGKWETLVSSAIDLLQAIGFGDLNGTKPDYPFGRKRYDISSGMAKEIGENYASCTIRLKKDERQRRIGKNGSSTQPAKEIIEQIKNIPKWLAWREALSFMKTQG